MRIISNFHDYYDGVQKVDQDRQLVYNRRSKMEELKVHIPFAHSHHDTGPIEYNQILIGFCGVLYPVLSLKAWNDKDRMRSLAGVIAFNLQEVDSFAERTLNEKNLAVYRGESKRPLYLFYRTATRDRIKNLFDKQEETAGSYRHIFEQAQCPVFITHPSAERGGKDKIEWNARLKDYEFYRKFGVQQAWQEISMFLGGLAEPRKPIPPISDETMAEIKGFNKFSFRKDKRKQ